jgi:hypothetical protein
LKVEERVGESKISHGLVEVDFIGLPTSSGLIAAAACSPVSFFSGEDNRL